MKILSVILLALALNHDCQSQVTFPEKDGKIVYEEIDSSVQASRATLFSRAKSWMANSFNNATAVIQQEDPVEGILLAKGAGKLSSPISASPMEQIEFSLEIKAKDNKYRIRIYDISGHPTSLASMTKSLEDVYSKFKTDNYPFKSKKEEKYQKEQKDRDNQALIDVNGFITYLLINLKKAMKTNDDF